MNLPQRLSTAARGALRAARFEALARFRLEAVRDDTVLYESFSGTGLLCNPEALFRELLAAPDQSHLRHVWVLDKAHRHDPAILREFRHNSRVSFVLRNSLGYYRAVSTSKYLITNSTFPTWFSKRPGQVYLNTWHGTPLKAMGYDMPNGAREGGNTLRNFVMADYLLSQNSFMTETMYGSAYKLRGHFRGRVIEEGYPRVDRQELDHAGETAVKSTLTGAGLRIGRRRIVLYAPTWKGSTFADPSDDIDILLGRVTELQERLGDEYIVLLKTHQILERFVGSHPALRRVLVPSTLPTNRLLGLVETLITDYSSIFFDFLATGRRIAFLAPESDDYETVRGTYFADDELPGPVCREVDEVARAILEPDPTAPWLRASTRDTWQQRFTPDPTGSTSRVIDAVFRGRTEGLSLIDFAPTDRASVLIHLGNLASNGITSAGINLVAALDADHVDVSVAYTRSNSQQQIDNAEAIAGNARQFPREGGMNGSKYQHLRRRLAYRRRDVAAHRSDPDQKRLWDDEWSRCFGASRFDVVVDFSGYSPLWSTLLLHSPDAARAIWLHNDMASEVRREVAGRHPLGLSLPSIFGLYPEYDALVAVSPALAEINETGLDSVVLGGRPIASAVNLIDAARIRRLATLPVFEGEELPEDGAIPQWVTALDRDDDCVWFVTVGRYTREKNQAMMLEAFAAVHAAEPRARLLLIGHGPLEDDLRDQIDRLGLSGAAFVTGALRNPFAVLRAADCFVLSSTYEGQPMVLLEAAVLGLPIVSTQFGSIRDVLPAGAIHVVESSPAALATGLHDYLTGTVSALPFDADAYNSAARTAFENAVGLNGNLASLEVVS